MHPALAIEDDELECLRRTIHWEARGLPMMEQEAVACVAINRTEETAFPDTICEVVKQGGTERYKCQFSWWCDGRSDEPRDRVAWREAKSRARAALLGKIADPTYGATYFHHARVSPEIGRASCRERVCQYV